MRSTLISNLKSYLMLPGWLVSDFLQSIVSVQDEIHPETLFITPFFSAADFEILILLLREVRHSLLTHHSKNITLSTEVIAEKLGYTEPRNHNALWRTISLLDALKLVTKNPTKNGTSSFFESCFYDFEKKTVTLRITDLGQALILGYSSGYDFLQNPLKELFTEKNPFIHSLVLSYPLWLDLNQAEKASVLLFFKNANQNSVVGSLQEVMDAQKKRAHAPWEGEIKRLEGVRRTVKKLYLHGLLSEQSFLPIDTTRSQAPHLHFACTSLYLSMQREYEYATSEVFFQQIKAHPAPWIRLLAPQENNRIIEKIHQFLQTCDKLLQGKDIGFIAIKKQTLIPIPLLLGEWLLHELCRTNFTLPEEIRKHTEFAHLLTALKSEKDYQHELTALLHHFPYLEIKNLLEKNISFTVISPQKTTPIKSRNESYSLRSFDTRSPIEKAKDTLKKIYNSEPEAFDKLVHTYLESLDFDSKKLLISLQSSMKRESFYLSIQDRLVSYLCTQQGEA